MSHTKGPWKAEHDGRDVRVNAPGGLYIARTYAIPVEDNPDDAYRLEQSANARLIAAAPDLLAALKAWLDAGNDAEDQVAVSMAMAAVAKAEQP